MKSSWQAHLRHLVLYGMNGGLILALKLLLMQLVMLFAVPAVAYFLVHVVVFFASYVIHSKASFQASLSFERMRSYFGAVILFKTLDYLLFAVAFVALDIHALWSVVAASIPVFFLRFVIVRRILTRSEPQPEV